METNEYTDPNGEYPLKAGAFVGFDYSTTKLQGGQMLVISPDGKNKIPVVGPEGFIFRPKDARELREMLETVESGDFNTLTDSGQYVIKTVLSNAPSQELGILRVINTDVMISQSMQTVSDEVWVRNKHDGAWTDWRQTTQW